LVVLNTDSSLVDFESSTTALVELDDAYDVDENRVVEMAE
jgi:hypothetical protein